MNSRRSPWILSVVTRAPAPPLKKIERAPSKAVIALARNGCGEPAEGWAARRHRIRLHRRSAAQHKAAGDGCHINLYGGLYFPNYYFTLVADMPAYCGCKFIMRKYPMSPDEDIMPNSVLVVGNEMDEMELLDAAVIPVLRILLRMLENDSPALQVRRSHGRRPRLCRNTSHPWPLSHSTVPAMSDKFPEGGRPECSNGHAECRYMLHAGPPGKTPFGPTRPALTT